MSDDERRRSLGGNDEPVEEEIEESFDRIVDEGAQRLHRTWWEVLITGFFGGIEVGIGVMGFLATEHATGSKLLAGLAFSVGFIALLLAKSELFTEGFLVPITAVAAKAASVSQLTKLWAGTLVANLAGGWLFMWLVMTAFPEWSSLVADTAFHFVGLPFSLQAVCLAVLGGSTITLMTRMQQGTESISGKIAAAVGGAYLLAALPLFHSILDSLIIFGAIHSGADISYGQWLRWFGYTALFNVLGGLVLVTGLRLVRSKNLLAKERSERAAD